MRWVAGGAARACVALLGLAAPALASGSIPFPTYQVGPQPDGSVVLSTGQIVTPSGTLVPLGAPVRAKAVAVNPNTASHTAAVLQMGAEFPVQIIDLATGTVVQSYKPATGSSGSYGGLAYSPDGGTLYFSQGAATDMAIAHVSSQGLLTEAGKVGLPRNPAIAVYRPGTAYPGGIAVSADGAAAYVLLNNNNTVGVVDTAARPPALVRQIRVGNAPNSILIDGTHAYVSNEGGRMARAGNVTGLSAGAPGVADPASAAATGTVSVIDLTSNTVIKTIPVGLHPTGLAMAGRFLLVANAYSDSLSVIDTASNTVVRTVALPMPGAGQMSGLNPDAVAVVGGQAYVALYTANAIAVLDLTRWTLTGMIPTASTPTTIAYDAARNRLVVSNDKGTGALAAGAGATGFDARQDSGTVELIPLPDEALLAAMTRQVALNNHWDLTVNTQVGAAYANPAAAPVAVPAHIGEPSLIKHVFLIIRENRTYDQVLGDVAAGNGDPALAVFGQTVTPNQHALVRRFPLLDNYYNPSRQSADGHNWIVQSMAASADDLQAPDWVRSYPSQGGDSLAYTAKGFLWQAARRKGLTVAMFGAYSEHQTIAVWPTPSWSAFYAASQAMEAGKPSPLAGVVTEYSSIPSVAAVLDRHVPSFNTGIPDQYRVDMWLPRFAEWEATGTLPALVIMALPDDHTSGYSAGYPVPGSAVADNDLALGRIVDAVSHSRDWATTAIFVTEDDAQNGVDHVDGHRSTGFVISPYAVQTGLVDHTHYNQMNMVRTIENILGLQPMTIHDLVASPMFTLFTDTPDAAPWTHLPNTTPLDILPPTRVDNSLPSLWMQASTDMFRGRFTRPDSVDADALNHADWYAATQFMRPYPGESRVRPPSEFVAKILAPAVFDIDP